MDCFQNKGWTLIEFAGFVDSCETFEDVLKLCEQFVASFSPVHYPCEVKGGIGILLDGRVVIRLFMNGEDVRSFSFSRTRFTMDDYFIGNISREDEENILNVDYTFDLFYEECMAHDSAILRFVIFVMKLFFVDKIALNDNFRVKINRDPLYISILHYFAGKKSLYEISGFRYLHEEKLLDQLRGLHLVNALHLMQLEKYTTTLPVQVLTSSVATVASSFLLNPTSQLCECMEQFTSRIHERVRPREMELDLTHIILSDY